MEVKRKNSKKLKFSVIPLIFNTISAQNKTFAHSLTYV